MVGIHGGRWRILQEVPDKVVQPAGVRRTLVGVVSAPDVSHVVLAVRGSWEYESEIKTAWMFHPQNCCLRCSRCRHRTGWCRHRQLVSPEGIPLCF